MRARCPAITQTGERCQRYAEGADGYCWGHSPKHAEKRSRMASKAGKSRPHRLVQEIHAAVDEVAEKVLSGEIRPYPGMVFGQLMGVKIRLLEFEQRLAQLEQSANNNGSHAWVS